MKDFADRIAGSDISVPILGGGLRRYVNLDHAASTPPFLSVLRAVTDFSAWYANVHRGTGFKSRLSSWAYDEARRIVMEFVGADPATHVAVFTRNTTESLNHLAHQLDVKPGQVIVTTMMEHHSNDLPWRRVAPVVHAPLNAAGRVDEEALCGILREHHGRVALLAVSGASNVTGLLNPIHRYAEWAHEAGAPIVVDGAQLVPHRPVDIGHPRDPGHIDWLAFSGHKMYAPFGAGVLVGPRAGRVTAPPRLVGGGTVRIVDRERVVYADSPERDEAGTPCIMGAVAIAAAIRELRTIGWDAIVSHEQALGRAALRGLREIPGVTVYGGGDDRLAVVPFNVEGLPHALVSAILSEEWGIGTRSGCFCAHPYVKAMLHLTEAESLALEARMIADDHSDIPGMVRASFGLSNTMDDVARLTEAVRAIAGGRFQQCYAIGADGEYAHHESRTDFAEFFTP